MILLIVQIHIFVAILATIYLVVAATAVICLMSIFSLIINYKGDTDGIEREVDPSP